MQKKFSDMADVSSVQSSIDRLWAEKKFHSLAEFGLGLRGKLIKEIDSYRSAMAGASLAMIGNLERALPFFVNAYRKDPDNPDNQLNYGNCLKDLGNFEGALSIYLKGNLSSSDPEIMLGAIVCEFELGHYHAAKIRVEEALKKFSSDKRILYQGGRVFFKFEKAKEAVDLYTKALEIEPTYEAAALNLALAAGKAKDLHVCVHLAEQIIANKRESDAFLQTLMPILLEAGAPKAAVQLFEKSKVPHSAKTLYSAAELFRYIKENEKSADLVDKVIQKDASYAAAYLTSYHVHSELGEYKVAASARNKYIARVKPEEISPQAIPNPWTLFAVLDDPVAQLALARRYADLSYNRLPRQFRPKKKRTGESLPELVFLSPDFGNHPVAECMLPIFEAMKGAVKLTALSLRNTEDDMTGKIESSVDRFVRCSAWSYDEIRTFLDGIEADVVFDLAGYTANGRPNFMALGLAPIQINFLGYSGTTGANAYDYNLVDKWIAPEGYEKFYSEKLLRLDQPLMSCNLRSTRHLVPFGPERYGIPDSAFIFGCLAAGYKCNEEVISVWASILNRVEHSVLLLANAGDSVKERVRAVFEKKGVDSRRIYFAAREETRDEHLSRLKMVDLFLDPWPYNAHSLAADAVSAGVPLITLKGESTAARIAASLVEGLGFSSLVVSSPAEYEERAVELGHDREQLGRTREGLKVAVESGGWAEGYAAELLRITTRLLS